MEEQHAVPQDITGFKFKLVGDMTLKQFGELAFGAIMAWMFYASNWHPFLKWPLTLFFGFLGVALAFLPIEERPLDVWIINFFRAIYHPTYYVWKKDASGVVAATAATPQVIRPPVFSEPAAVPMPKTDLATLPPAPMKPAPEKLPEPPVKAAPPSVSITELEKIRAEKMANLAQATKKPGVEKPAPAANIVTVDKLAQMHQQMPPVQVSPKAPVTVAPPWAMGATDQARVVDRPVKPSPTISLTKIPNIINGTVSDQRGAPMEGVILVIKDKTGNSVRALKTNRIGQFIASTPLPNGTYYLEFEMPHYEFNVYEIALTGEMLKPLLVKGKYLGDK